MKTNSATKMSTFFVLLSTSLLASSLLYASGSDENEKGVIILDGTKAPSVPVITTNLKTGVEENAPAGVPVCDDDEAIDLHLCNGFSQNNIQMITAGGSNGLTANIGVNNPQTTSYNNKGTTRQVDLFGDNHLFDLDRFRYASNKLTLRNTSLPAGTYGTISWQQFVQNVADGKTMYGIVRVLIPLEKIREVEKYSALDYGSSTDSPFIKAGYSSRDYNDYKGKLKSRKSGRYGLCPKNQPQSKCGCTPNEETELEPGATVCGIKLGQQAKVDVRGAILFDFVDCTDMKPLALENISAKAQELSVEIGVPVYVNPANPDTDGTLKNLTSLAQLTQQLNCPNNAAHCSLAVTQPVSWRLISEQSKTSWQIQNQSILTEAVFNQLSKTEQYKLALPSGYASGWKTAFDKLNINKQDWRSLGFNAPEGSGPFSLTDIISPQFEDVPVYMYSGGMISMGFHINISGLIYIPHAFELEQEDSETYVCSPYKHEANDVNGYDHKSDDCHEENETNALQYIAGSVIVRDAFFIEAEHGTTIISNDPDSYNSMRVSATSGIAGQFKPVSANASTTTDANGSSSNSEDDENNNGGNSAANTGLPTAIEWVEIRP